MTACKHLAALKSFNRAVAKLVQETAAPVVPHDNPYGLVLVAYCRECDCTHSVLLEPDGTLGTTVMRAAAACKKVSTCLRINPYPSMQPTETEEKNNGENIN